jgi:hypothetical protein
MMAKKSGDVKKKESEYREREVQEKDKGELAVF